MKRFFTLLVAMCAALCTYADELTFSVAVEGNTVTVTPSDLEQLYLCAAIDEEEAATFAQMSGVEISIDTPENLFLIASIMYNDKLFTGVSTQTCNDGKFYLVMCGAMLNEEGKIAATTPISVQALTIGDTPGGEEPEPEPLTFTFASDNEGFTVTPSDNEQEYLAYPFPPEQVEKFQNASMPLKEAVENYIRMFVAWGQAKGHTDKGEVHHIAQEYLDEGEVFVDGVYLVAVVGIKTENGRQSVTTPASLFEWVVDHSEAGIHGIEASNVFNLGKVYKDGKIIINGRVNLNGTLVR